MQKIAAEMKLSETAFVMPADGAASFSASSRFLLRWFTPTVRTIANAPIHEPMLALHLSPPQYTFLTLWTSGRKKWTFADMRPSRARRLWRWNVATMENASNSRHGAGLFPPPVMATAVNLSLIYHQTRPIPAQTQAQTQTHIGPLRASASENNTRLPSCGWRTLPPPRSLSLRWTLHYLGAARWRHYLCLLPTGCLRFPKAESAR